MLVAAFLACGPLLALSAGHLARARGLSEVRSERSWQQVNAVLTRSAPRAASPYDTLTPVWVPGRWRLASGKVRTGYVPAEAGTPAGSVVSIWLDKAGRVTGRQPLTQGIVLLRVVVAELATLMAVGIALAGIALFLQWLLNRRRLARWAVEWSLVGPRWTMRR